VVGNPKIDLNCGFIYATIFCNIDADVSTDTNTSANAENVEDTAQNMMFVSIVLNRKFEYLTKITTKNTLFPRRTARLCRWFAYLTVKDLGGANWFRIHRLQSA
jgi:hypothetical protein